MQQSRVKQFADDERHATGRVELIDVSLAAWIDMRECRDDVAQGIEIIPVDFNTCGSCDSDDMQGVVG